MLDKIWTCLRLVALFELLVLVNGVAPASNVTYHDFIDYFDMDIMEDNFRKPLKIAVPKECLSPYTRVPVCCNGYFASSQHKEMCLPKCKDNCPNGYCVKPNVCKCFHGYRKNEQGDCVPVCPKGCQNGDCLADGTCGCKRNFVLDASGKSCVSYCYPACGEHEVCSELMQCKCAKGYFRGPNATKCEPVCEQDCLHGQCVAPDTCACSKGYKRINGICQANCWQNCIHGTCTENNRCVCQKGYKLDLATLKCKQECDGCTHGTCLNSRQCSCFKGYELKDGKCKPICKKNCENALCIAPDRCVCKTGYKRSLLTQKCVPVSQVPAKPLQVPQQFAEMTAAHAPKVIPEREIVETKENGTKCVYRTVSAPPNPQTVEDCCKGYVRNPFNVSSCVPHCNKCANGNCVAPEQCVCNPGYTHDMDNNCVPTCPSGCVNGWCEGGLCRCHNGYQLEPRMGLFCVPTCLICGQNSNCTNPNVCHCLPGYKPKPNSIDCEPICEKPCTNGICVAPNTCACNPEFKLENNECKTTCTRRCHNGYCRADGACICYPGHDLINDICVPRCNLPCVNGYCKSPDKCVCLLGYIADGQPGGNNCVPYCEGGCVGGRCEKPNVCVCPQFHRLVGGVCQKQIVPPKKPKPTPILIPVPVGPQAPYVPGPQYPFVPGQQLPYVPGQQLPYVPGQQQPYIPGQQYPYVPGQQQPYFPGQQQPYFPGQQQPYVPGQQQPYVPGQQQPYVPVPQPPQPPPLKPSTQKPPRPTQPRQEEAIRRANNSGIYEQAPIKPLTTQSPRITRKTTTTIAPLIRTMKPNATTLYQRRTQPTTTTRRRTTTTPRYIRTQPTTPRRRITTTPRYIRTQPTTPRRRPMTTQRYRPPQPQTTRRRYIYIRTTTPRPTGSSKCAPGYVLVGGICKRRSHG